MAEKFNLTELVNRSLPETSDDSNPAHPTSGLTSLHLLYIKYKRKVWIVFYSTFIASVVTSAIFIEKSNLAVNIMNQVRQDQQLASIVLPQVSDLSSFSITTDPGLTALVTFPDGKRVGEDAENVRFFEIPNVYMTQQSSVNSNWSINIKKPPNGIYQVDIFSQEPGEYAFSFQSYDASGENSTNYQFRLIFTQNQVLRYQLIFDKDNHLNTKFTSSQTISE